MAEKKKRNENKHLFYMSELSDYKIASKDPDVRGWDVKDRDNRVIGKVDDLLVNKDAERVVYLDVEVDSTIIEANHDPYVNPSNSDVHEFINKEGENHIIIPVGLVSLNENNNFVYTDSIDHRTFAETKRYGKGSNIDRDYEVVVLESYNRDEGKTRSGKVYGETDEESSYRADRNISEAPREERGSAEYERKKQSAIGDDWESDTERRENSRRERYADDDSFYDRREFEGKNYRQRREE